MSYQYHEEKKEKLVGNPSLLCHEHSSLPERAH